MKKLNPEYRYEIKYVLPYGGLEFIEQWVRCHSHGFIQPYEDRHVNSVYLDTLNLDAYHENLSGVSSRKKFRFRWYGNHTEGSSSLRYEVKNKDNRLCFKEVYSFDNFDGFSQDKSWVDQLENYTTQLMFERPELMLGYLTPVIVSSYRRKYFQAIASPVRITLDFDHSSLDQWLVINPNLCRYSEVPNPVVLEIKYPKSWSGNIALLTSDLEAKYSRHSKYLVNTANSLP